MTFYFNINKLCLPYGTEVEKVSMNRLANFQFFPSLYSSNFVVHFFTEHRIRIVQTSWVYVWWFESHSPKVFSIWYVLCFVRAPGLLGEMVKMTSLVHLTGVLSKLPITFTSGTFYRCTEHHWIPLYAGFVIQLLTLMWKFQIFKWAVCNSVWVMVCKSTMNPVQWILHRYLWTECIGSLCTISRGKGILGYCISVSAVCNGGNHDHKPHPL